MIELQAETQSQLDVLIKRLSSASQSLQRNETSNVAENIENAQDNETTDSILLKPIKDGFFSDKRPAVPD